LSLCLYVSLLSLSLPSLSRNDATGERGGREGQTVVVMRREEEEGGGK